jgi:hypothetical protein
MLEFDLSQLNGLIKKFRNDDKIHDIVESEFLNMLGYIAENTVGQENHEFKNDTFLLEGSVDYFVKGNTGYIVSEDVEYNSYVYYGETKHNVTWKGDPWIENTWNKKKSKALKDYKKNLTEELYGYLT